MTIHGHAALRCFSHEQDGAHNEFFRPDSADAFLQPALREVVPGSYTDAIAYEIHNYYEAKYGGMPYSKPWEELPENIKESNRVQAREIPKYLAMVGCSYDAGDTPFPSIEAFTKDEIELLAQHAHVVWMNDKLADGWVYGPVRDNAQKIHPLLVPWVELPEGEKEKDRDIAVNIIPQLKNVGLRVYRMV